jgi:hypothetical protein
MLLPCSIFKGIETPYNEFPVGCFYVVAFALNGVGAGKISQMGLARPKSVFSDLLRIFFATRYCIYHIDNFIIFLFFMQFSKLT